MKCWCTATRRSGSNEENSKRSPLPSNLFGRNLYAAVPGLSVTQPRGADGKQVRVYTGIGLRW